MSNSIKYGFFDSSYDLIAKGYSGQDRMSPKQFIVMGTVFVLIIVLSLLLRKAGKEKLFTVYKALAVLMPVLEISKIAFSTYHDLKHGEPFNLGGILPLYTCSMILYFLPLLAWGKGWIQRTSAAFFVSIGMAAGLTNFVYLSAAGWYPIFTFGGLYSVVFHGVLVFVGVSLLITGQYISSLKTIFEGMIPVLIFGALVIPANFLIKNVPGFGNVDYMMLMNANGFIHALSGFFAERHLQLLFSLLMLFVAYPLAAAAVVMIEMGVRRLTNLFTGRNAGKNHSEGAEESPLLS